MMKRLLATLVAIGMAAQLSGCTSSAPKDESDVATSGDENFTEEKSADFQDGTQTAEQPVGDQAAPSDLAAEDNLDLDAPADPNAPPATAQAGDLSLDDADPEHEFPDNVAQAPPAVDGPAPAAPPAPTDENLFASTPPPTDAPPAEPPPADPLASEPPPADPVASEPPPASAKPARVAYSPLLKIKDQPFTQKGALLNRVYVARQGDSWKSVSEKIYGMNDAGKLKSWNPSISGRALKVGDKVYYNSPRDASDSARMLTYYEDMGIPHQTYATKDGDNLRVVGKELLGDKNSWKELWVTNRDLASKGALPAGIEIRYWPDSGVAAPAPAQTMAQNPPPAPPAPPAPPPNDGLVPPPTGDQAMMDPLAASGQPPADPNAGAAAGTVAPPEPPPPPPPPPPIAAAPKRPKAVEPVEPAGGDQDTMMMLGAGGILLLAAVATFVVIRKNRSKRIDLSQTQV